MKDEFEERLFELLEQAVAWPVEEWQQRAAKACADGPVPAVKLLKALARDAELGDFLESPAWKVSGALEIRSPEDWVGRQIGRYRLLEPLGHGGMGLVFLAEQQEPERRVALKLIRDEAVSETSVERFRAEQQALARLNHPHIAQFLEADLTEEGQPYFAMEWVDGVPIDTFLLERSPDLDQRLSLFLELCGAVHYAHQKQVVHRDLKPSNILVREIDGRPHAKVIDFGIAEALDRPLGVRRENTQVSTSSGSLYGTPEYLSPESFDGDVDTRADVYSLGVLLYQLVSGERPFHRSDAGAGDLVERICRGEKEPASQAAVRNSKEQSPGGRDRREWPRRVQGDLDAVIDKAMHPDRDRRYGTAASLARDIDRFLQSLPVEARPVGSFHLFRLLLRRRRGVVLAASIATLSLILGTVGATFGLLRAQQEAEATRHALAESEALAGFLTDLFEQSEPSRAQGEELTARELLDQGMERLETGLEDQPRLRADLTRTVGDIYAKLGHYSSAEVLLLRSRALFEKEFGREHPQVVRALHGLGVLKGKAGEAEAAKSYFLQAQALEDVAPGVEPIQKSLTGYHLGS